MAYAARLTRSRLVAAREPRSPALGYAIPGAVIAVGVLVPLGRLDNCARRRARSGVRRAASGLLLTGTIVALVYAYLVRFLAVALQTVGRRPGAGSRRAWTTRRAASAPTPAAGAGARARAAARAEPARPRRCWCSSMC